GAFDRVRGRDRGGQRRVRDLCCRARGAAAAATGDRSAEVVVPLLGVRVLAGGLPLVLPQVGRRPVGGGSVAPVDRHLVGGVRRRPWVLEIGDRPGELHSFHGED